MPKVRPHSEIGCLVTGVCRLADGRPRAALAVRFTPGRGGVWNGRVIGKTPVTVQTDSHGRFRITLAPSAAVGRYSVQMDDANYTIDVPDAAEARFADIVVS